jgi:hypothetical protein
MPQVGDKKRNTKTGQVAVFDGQGWQLQGGAPQSNSGAQKSFDRTLGTEAAKNVIAWNENSAGAIDTVRQGESLISRLPNTPSGPFAEFRAGAANMGIPLMSKNQAANMAEMKAFSSDAVLSDAAKLKPLSNSDVAFLQTLQAGPDQNQETNRRFLIARQWAATKQAAKARAANQWSARLGSPLGRNKSGQDFESWFEGWSAQNIPRPDFGGAYGPQARGGYRPPRQPAKSPQTRGPAKGGNDMSRMTDDQLRALIARGQ